MPKPSSTDDDWILGSAASTPTDFIGPYRVIEKIGSGGMSDVFRVHDESLDREIALKLIRPTPFSNAEVRAQQEIKILKQLNHDGIVRLLGEGVSNDGQTYFTMEYVEGMCLADLLSQMRKPPSTVRDLLAPLESTPLLGGPMSDLTDESPAYVGAIRIVQQIAMALDYLHGQGIIHRDVKPSNILMKPNGRALLTDFGIAHVPRGSGVVDLTKPDTFLGTDRYAAPEQHVGKSVDGRADVYGLGAVLYELVCGVRLFDDIENPRELTAAVQTQRPRPPILLAPEIPPELNMAILRALHREPTMRFANAITFAEVLQEFIAPPRPKLMEKAARTSWWIIKVCGFMGILMTASVATAMALHDQLKEYPWPHPLFPALAPLVVMLVLGIIVAVLWYALCFAWDLLCRFWAWLRRSKSAAR